MERQKRKIVNANNNLYAKLFGRYKKEKMNKFLKYHHANPHVYKAFCQLAKQWKDKGKSKCSAALLGNVLRWQCSLETQSDDFKISNDWLPIYARILAFKDITYLDFFDFKGLQ